MNLGKDEFERERIVESPYMEDPGEVYETPRERANGRPHEAGWMDDLIADEKANAPEGQLGEMKPGKIY